MTALQTHAAMILFGSGHFDSVDISALLDVSEPEVVRVLGAARSAAREQDRSDKRVHGRIEVGG